jgi:small conductance mechanosensitive channel
MNDAAQSATEAAAAAPEMLENVYAALANFATTYGLKVIGAILILIIGRIIAGQIRKGMRKLGEARGWDPSLTGFLSSLVYFFVMAFVIIAVLGSFGVQTASIVAVLGAASFAVGLALQGSLANFAAGFLMVIFRPINVGDYIEGAGVAGTVEEIQIFTTTLVTPDNKTVIIPNANMTSDNIVNWSAKGIRRVDMVFGIGYDDDIDKARQIMEDVLAKDERILKDKPTQIAVVELADSSVNFVVRPWANVSDYWGVYLDAMENIKKAFDDQGISIPYPQQDVHLHQVSA